MCKCAFYPRFDRDDSVLSDVIGENCDNEEWPEIFMAGMITAMTDDDEGCIMYSNSLKLHTNKFH